jgi:uncharacterized damage-inducible protein DinB
VHEISRIIDQFEREFEGDPWHGSPLSSILAGVSHVQAAATPIAGAHSIWELVLHLAAWKNEVRRRLSGAPAAEPQEGDWPKVGETTAERWHAALEHLEVSHRLLISAVRDFPEQDLYIPSHDLRDREQGTGVTYYEMLHGLVQHDVYHSGQIALLRKASR